MRKGYIKDMSARGEGTMEQEGMGRVRLEGGCEFG